MKINEMNSSKWIMYILLASSFALLSFYQIVRYQRWFIIFTIILSFLFSLYFIMKTSDDNWKYVKEHPVIGGMIFFITVSLIIAMYQSKGIPNLELRFELVPFCFFALKWWLLAAPALFYLLIWVWQKISQFLVEFWRELDDKDKKLYIVLTILFSVLIPILYILEPQWYLQYDRVYSIDSGYCSQKLFPQMTYYDIRHPILSTITFPIWVAVRVILCLFVPLQLLDILCVACVQIINIQFLLLVGFMIGKLSKNPWVTRLYFASSPVLLFMLFFEKYQICVFLLVLYVYQFCQKRNGTETCLVVAAGAMTTSIFLGLIEVITKESIINKLKRVGRLVGQGIIVLICFGRIHLLNPVILLNEVHYAAHRWGFKDFSITECWYAFTKMVHGAFWGLDSVSEAKYLWSNIVEGISINGVILLVLVFIGIIVNRKNYFVKICAVWIGCAFLLFAVFKWSVHESPLFSIYFSWAIVPLVQKGLEYIRDKFHWSEKFIYGVFLVSMLGVNVLNIIDIGHFLW